MLTLYISTGLYHNCPIDNLTSFWVKILHQNMRGPTDCFLSLEREPCLWIMKIQVFLKEQQKNNYQVWNKTQNYQNIFNAIIWRKLSLQSFNMPTLAGPHQGFWTAGWWKIWPSATSPEALVSEGHLLWLLTWSQRKQWLCAPGGQKLWFPCWFIGWLLSRGLLTLSYLFNPSLTDFIRAVVSSLML